MTTKYLFIATLVFFMTLTFTSCSDDNDGIDGNASTTILGTWQSVSIYEYEIENGEKTEERETYTEDLYSFTDDGTGFFSTTDGSDYYDFDWRVSGNQLILNEGSIEEEVYTIKKLNAKNLVISIYYEEEGYEYYGEETFQKVEH